MGRSKLVLSALVLALASAPALARAQSAEDKAAADAAFDQGKRLMAAHSYPEACQKFSESLRRDPGIGTMLGLADCFEKNGQTASAWAQFREAASTAARKTDPREKVAREQASRLEPLLSRLLIHVPRASNVSGLQVRRDGVDVGAPLWDTEVPLDPGVHTVSAVAPGKKEWQASITVAAHPGVETVNVPALEAAPLPPPIVAATDTTNTIRPTNEPIVAAKDPGRTQRQIALGVAGAGAVGIAIGAIFGFNAQSKNNASNDNGHCDASNACDTTGLGLRSDAKSAATISTIGFVVGGVAVAGGAVLWFTAPKSTTARVGLVPSVGGGAFVGTW